MPQPALEAVSVVAADEGDEAALNLDAVWTEDAGFVGRVCGFEGHGGPLAAEALQRGFFAIDKGDNDVAGVRGFGAAQDDEIA